MTNQEAMKMIQDRIESMISNEEVQKILVTMKLSGKTDTECRNWLQSSAIATLCGI